MAMAMTHAPPSLLAPTGSSTSLVRLMGSLGPALATLVWSISSYEPEGLRGAMTLATILSALSAVAVMRVRLPGEQASVRRTSVRDSSVADP